MADDNFEKMEETKLLKCYPAPQEIAYIEYHPCLHRWLRNHSETKLSKNFKFFLRPVSDRTKSLANPLARRLLELWLSHSHIMSPNMKARVLEMLNDYGFTEDLLLAMLEAQRLERERLARIAAAGPFDVLDENGYPLTPNWVFKPFGQKKKKRRKKISNVWKPGKPGQLKPGWPHQTGLQLLMLLLNVSTPDEEYISKVRAYFDVQAHALFKIILQILDPYFGIQEWPSSIEKIIAIGCLNFCVWLAKNIIVPAESIEDEDIKLCLSWKGEIPPKLRNKRSNRRKNKKKKAKGKMKKNKVGLKKKNKKRKGKKSSVAKIEPSIQEVVDPQPQDIISENLSTSPEILNPQQTAFLNQSFWYNPLSPEFLLTNEKFTEKPIEFEEFFESTLWNLKTVSGFHLQPLIPNPVPVFSRHLRPNMGCVPENEDSPWYIMSNPDYYVEVTDEWDTANTKETFETLAELIKNMISIENFSRSQMLTLLSEICDAIKTNKIETDVSPEIEILDAKRTIMFERIFIQMFSTKFRDFDENTCGYMEIICSRAAELVRFLCQHTAQELWKFQHSPPPTPPTPEPEDEPYSDFDEELYEKWNHWLEFLLKATHNSNNWQHWIADITTWEDLPSDKAELVNKAENWLEKGFDTCREAEQFKANADNLDSITTRPNRLENCFCHVDKVELIK